MMMLMLADGSCEVMMLRRLGKGFLDSEGIELRGKK